MVRQHSNAKRKKLFWINPFLSTKLMPGGRVVMQRTVNAPSYDITGSIPVPAAKLKKWRCWPEPRRYGISGPQDLISHRSRRKTDKRSRHCHLFIFRKIGRLDEDSALLKQNSRDRVKGSNPLTSANNF